MVFLAIPFLNPLFLFSLSPPICYFDAIPTPYPSNHLANANATRLPSESFASTPPSHPNCITRCAGPNNSHHQLAIIADRSKRVRLCRMPVHVPDIATVSGILAEG